MHEGQRPVAGHVGRLQEDQPGDAQLLAQVYVELTGGRQIGLGLVADTDPREVHVGGPTVTVREPRVPRPHFASAEELEAHRAFIAQMAQFSALEQSSSLARDITLLRGDQLRGERALLFDGVFNGLEDEAGLSAEAAAGRALGFDGKSLIHPRQIAPCHAAFAPGVEEIERARALVAAFGGGAERFGDEMIERMHVEAAQRLLARAKRG